MYQYYQFWRGTFEIQKVFNYDCHGLFLYNTFKSRYCLISIKIDAWGGGCMSPPPHSQIYQYYAIKYNCRNHLFMSKYQHLLLEQSIQH